MMPPSSPTDTQARNDASPLLVFPLLPSPSSPAHKALGSRASVYTYQFGKSDDDVSISCKKSQRGDCLGFLVALCRFSKSSKFPLHWKTGSLFHSSLFCPGLRELRFPSFRFVCPPRSPFPTRRAQRTPPASRFLPLLRERGY